MKGQSMSQTVVLPKAKGLLLLGGGALLLRIARFAVSINLPVRVISGPRQMNEICDGEEFASQLSRIGIDYISASTLESEEVSLFLRNTKEYLRISLGAPWIMSESVLLELFGGPILNAHGTQLPRDRGAGGFSWRILQEHRIGCCILHVIDGGIDTGPIVASKEFIYPASLRTPQDHEDLYWEKAYHLISDFIENTTRGEQRLKAIEQQHNLSTYWPRLNTGINGWIDWSIDALELERFIRAFDRPYPGALTRLGMKKVHIRQCTLTREECGFHPYQFGMIYRRTDEWICVAARNGTLILEEVIDTERNSVLKDIRVGDRFRSTEVDLEASTSRVTYTAKGLSPQ